MHCILQKRARRTRDAIRMEPVLTFRLKLRYLGLKCLSKLFKGGFGQRRGLEHWAKL